MCRVVNKYKDKFDVYIGRGSKWGNPFPMNNKSDEERKRVIKEYRKYLWNQLNNGEITVDELLELDGKTLGCFCKPKECHGDVIVSAINYFKSQLNQPNHN